MQVAPLPRDEARRIAALQQLAVLDSPPEAEFDALTRTASILCGAPISLISLIDSDRQWLKSARGLEGVTETSRDIAFCAHTILTQDLFEVPDATRDPRFADNPMVTGAPNIRFYAGVPLILSDGQSIGALCVIDREPGKLTVVQREALIGLAHVTTQLLEGRRARRAQQTAADALLISHERLWRLYEATPAMLHSIDQSGRLLAVSDLWLKKFGYSREEVIGQPTTMLLTPESRDKAVNVVIPTLFRDGRSENVPYQAVTKSGEVIDITLSAIIDVDERTGERRSLSVVEDVTERHRAESALKEVHDRVTLATDSGRIGIWDWDMVADRLSWDAWMWRTYGEEPREGLQTYADFARRLHPEDLPRVEEVLRRTLESDKPYQTEFRVILPDGGLRHVRATGSLRRDASGRPIRLIGANWDVTESRELAAELAAQHELLRVTLQSIADAVITTDQFGKVVWLNPVAEWMTGWAATDARGRPLLDLFRLVDEATRQPITSPVEQCLSSRSVVELDQRAVLVAGTGVECAIEAKAAPIIGEDRTLLGSVLVFHDVTEQRRKSREISYRASHDALTGLINRGEFEHRLTQVLRRADDPHAANVLVYLDLDQFKVVNDTCGHAVGDRLLRQAAMLFRASVRESDTVARIGGDEFAIILTHCTLEMARQIAQKICDRLEDYSFVHDDKRFRIGVSIGLVPVDQRWSGPSQIVQAADAACYAAKEAGRNRVSLWQETETAGHRRRTERQWANLIEAALEGDGFVLLAQRIHPTSGDDGGIRAEVLLRLRGDDGSLILPGAFLPAADRFDLSARIDRWVMTHVLAWLRGLADPGAIVSIGVNLTPTSIGDRGFHRWMAEALRDLGPVLAAKLDIEVAESAVLGNLADASDFFAQVRALGARVSLDDFGAGAASFSYLKTLPVDTLKIDGQFIRNMADDPIDALTVRFCADIARLSHIETVAEGVESVDCLAGLKALGMTYVQGFAFDHPARLDQLLDRRT